ncbi:MAG TPA: glutamine-hydrolyzing GMP synthase [Vicinamibacterales bacterium]|nr:glutamine-hydrolyzing GMP synthase [Vicinamibacterales bacterium]
MHGIAVLDAGGQYCHLLARRVREAGIQSHVLPIDTNSEQLAGISGIIISGGPRSVTDAGSPRVDLSILAMGVPILGICYGHQLLAATMPGGVVKPSFSSEYGLANLRLATGLKPCATELFDAVPESSRVWVSHGDSVETLPDGFEVLGSTDDCAVAAMGHAGKKIYGVQFHPEVTHTEHGQQLLRNFIRNVCRCESNWKPSSAETIEAIKADVRASVGPDRKVLFFVSGGVDSTVAYKLCADALGQDRVHGVYVDTGFMRKNESADVMAAYEKAGFKNVRLRDASSEFLAAVGDETNPETKRKLIGSAFLSVESDVLAHLPREEWLLGQGTIYPDTIESGGTRESALIKTHHNRVPELLLRIAAGEIVEPLVQFYKDEVREIGRALGLPPRLIEKQPFPGPGLAVRFLCTDAPAAWSENAKLTEVVSGFNLTARVLPVRGVGVQGDERTYAHTALLTGGYDEGRVAELSPVITNALRDVNRVVFWAGSKGSIDEFRVEPTTTSREGLDVLREADARVRDILAEYDTQKKIWQCPVVLLPLKRNGESAIVIRPVESNDGMTAQYSKLPWPVIERLSTAVLAIPGVGALLYDVTNKPPATIEWE